MTVHVAQRKGGGGRGGRKKKQKKERRKNILLSVFVPVRKVQTVELFYVFVFVRFNLIRFLVEWLINETLVKEENEVIQARLHSFCRGFDSCI